MLKMVFYASGNVASDLQKRKWGCRMGKRDKVKAFAVLAAVLGTGAVAMPVCGAADIIGKRVLVEGTLPRAA